MKKWMSERIVRRKRIYIRVTDEEYKLIVSKAKNNNLSISEYTRKILLEDRVVIVPGVIELAKQVSKVGTNLNQLTVLAHQGRIKEVDLFPTKDALQQVLKEIKKLNRHKNG